MLSPKTSLLLKQEGLNALTPPPKEGQASCLSFILQKFKEKNPPRKDLEIHKTRMASITKTKPLTKPIIAGGQTVAKLQLLRSFRNTFNLPNNDHGNEGEASDENYGQGSGIEAADNNHKLEKKNPPNANKTYIIKYGK
jgi:hypothetical protein